MWITFQRPQNPFLGLFFSSSFRCLFFARLIALPASFRFNVLLPSERRTVDQIPWTILLDRTAEVVCSCMRQEKSQPRSSSIIKNHFFSSFTATTTTTENDRDVSSVLSRTACMMMLAVFGCRWNEFSGFSSVTPRDLTTPEGLKEREKERAAPRKVTRRVEWQTSETEWIGCVLLWQAGKFNRPPTPSGGRWLSCCA